MLTVGNEGRQRIVPPTGITVRALVKSSRPDERPDDYECVDIGELDKPSLLRWLRSRGGANEWAENVVAILLGFGPLHEPKTALGHKFVLMSENDWDAFAGAEPDTRICKLENTTLLLSPDGSITEVDQDGDVSVWRKVIG